MTNATEIPVGARVRVGKNDAGVPVGTEGTIARYHEASGLPIVRIGTPGQRGFRPVALTLDQLTMLGMPVEAVEPTNGQSPAPVSAKSTAPRWVRFDRVPATVTFSRNGIYLSRSAAAALGGVGYAEILYDRALGLVGIRSVSIADTPGSFEIERMTGGAYRIGCGRFVRLLTGVVGVPNRPMRFAARADADLGGLVVSGVPFAVEQDGRGRG